MIKRTALFALLALVPLGRAFAADPDAPASAPAATGGRRAVVVERVAAVVNDTVILESEVLQRAAPMMGELDRIEDPVERQRQWHLLVRQVLDDMVDEELIMGAAVEAKLDVTDEEITRAVDEVKKQNRLDDAKFLEALGAQGYTLSEYRKDVRRQILRLRAVNVLVRPRVSITDEEVRSRYERMSGQTAQVSQVHARHILIPLPEHATPEEMDAARRLAGDLVGRARAGEDFVKLAAAYSGDAGTKDKGGDLGWLKRGEIYSEWEEVLFGMSNGEVRGPVRGPSGLHVFQVVEARREPVRPYDQVKDQLKQELYATELDKQTRLWLEELHKKAHVEIKL
jgi:peptidyl-prolyl cis-trans isomerase SurA